MLRRLAVRSQLPICQVHVRAPHCAGLAAAKYPQLTEPAGLRLSERFQRIQSFAHQASAFSQLQKRCFAAKSASDADETEDAEALQKEASVLRKFYGAGTLLSGGLIAYGAWWGVKSAMAMVGAVYASPHIVAYVGFWAGFGTATMCAALATGVYRLTFIRPEFAFKDTFEIVKNNDTVKSTLGGTIRDGKLKSYEIKGGRFTVQGAMPTWVPHQLQMMYTIYGEKGSGLVTTVCVKQPSLLPKALDPNLLAVNFLNKETVMIVGDESQLETRDNIHRLLDLKLEFAKGSQK